ncbi:type II secretion system protein N [Hydrogenophaga sp. OTU3427]|uniref:type II secretion system protein N n=1 Tax=Hydrogenophaga sp. OTU3427 TaxID=3043856 RepID=UPI00313A8B35
MKPAVPRRPNRARTTPAATLPQRCAWLGGLLGLALALLLFAPARWLADGVARASGGHVLWPNASGTVWSGQADLLLTGGPGSRDATALPQGLRWRLSPGWDQAPVLRLHLNAPCCTSAGMDWVLRPGWGGVSLSLGPHQSQWPTQLLAGLGTPWNTLQLDGQLRLHSQGLRATWQAGRLQLAGALQLDALALSSQLSTLRPLGSYRLVLQAPTDGAGDATRLLLSTLDGALALRGEGQWVGGRLRFSGEAEAREGAEAALSNLLNIVGQRSGRRSRIALG